jgi:chitin disaccharide deacetylase
MVSPDGSFGIVVTGVLDQELFEAIIGCIPEGTWEFVCHPGYLDDDLFETRTRLRKSRETELQVLTSRAAREALHNNDIQLISYRQLC